MSALGDGEVEFVVIGGFSVAAHGYVRATNDLDIVPAPAPANLRRLAAALRELDAEVELGDMAADELGLEPDEHGLSVGGNWGLRTRYGRLDVMQDIPGVRSYAELRAGALSIGGVLYAGYEQVIAMKAASGREQDLTDIGALEAARRPPEGS